MHFRVKIPIKDINKAIFWIVPVMNSKSCDSGKHCMDNSIIECITPLFICIVHELRWALITKQWCTVFQYIYSHCSLNRTLSFLRYCADYWINWIIKSIWVGILPFFKLSSIFVQISEWNRIIEDRLKRNDCTLVERIHWLWYCIIYRHVV